jgi:mRNA interferase HigB
MHIIARKALREFSDTYPTAKSALDAWYHEVKRVEWRSPSDVLKLFPKARIIGKSRVIFNINNNRYRLVVKVNYASKTVFIRFVGTHKEYDRINVEEV